MLPRLQKFIDDHYLPKLAEINQKKSDLTRQRCQMSGNWGTNVKSFFISIAKEMQEKTGLLFDVKATICGTPDARIEILVFLYKIAEDCHPSRTHFGKMVCKVPSNQVLSVSCDDVVREIGFSNEFPRQAFEEVMTYFIIEILERRLTEIEKKT